MIYVNIDGNVAVELGSGDVSTCEYICNNNETNAVAGVLGMNNLKEASPVGHVLGDVSEDEALSQQLMLIFNSVESLDVMIQKLMNLRKGMTLETDNVADNKVKLVKNPLGENSSVLPEGLTLNKVYNLEKRHTVHSLDVYCQIVDDLGNHISWKQECFEDAE